MGNTYTDEELGDATRSIIDKPNDLNHTEATQSQLKVGMRSTSKSQLMFLCRVPKDASCSAGNLCQLIDDAEHQEKGIVNVSIEAKCLRGTTAEPEGNKCNGLCFTGMGWLTKDVLPGVPMTSIAALEKLLECLACPCSCNGSEITGDKNLEKDFEIINGFEVAKAGSYGLKEDFAFTISPEERAFVVNSLQEGFGDASYPDSCFDGRDFAKDLTARSLIANYPTGTRMIRRICHM